MSGNYIDSEERDTLLSIKLPKPPNRYQPAMLVIVLLSLGLTAFVFQSNDSLLFACTLSLLIFAIYKYTSNFIVLDRLWKYYTHIKSVQEVMTTPVESEDGDVKIYTFIQPNPEVLQRLLQLHLYAKNLRSSNK
jgi:hypothetical protein